MSVGELLLFGNVSQPPFCNNLYPPLRAFQKLFRTTLVEPSALPGFVSTGGAKPALIPDDSVFSHTDPPPPAVVCLGGALHLSARAPRMFPSDTVLAGFALSDPQGLEASLAIAPEFDSSTRRTPRRCRRTRPGESRRAAAIPPPIPSSTGRCATAPQCDLLYYGKWTPYRNDLLEALSARIPSGSTHTRARSGGRSRRGRRSTRPMPWRGALNGARLALETALVDDVHGKYRGTYRITPRAFFAASCGVPTLVESFPRLADTSSPASRSRPSPRKTSRRLGGQSARRRARPSRDGPPRPPAGPARAHVGSPGRGVRPRRRHVAKNPKPHLPA